MKILLISPPLFNPREPYLAVPSLKAFLEQNGHEVLQKDINIEFYNTVLSSAYLTGCYKLIVNKFNELNKKEVLSGNDKKLRHLLKKYISFATGIIKKVDRAKQFLKINNSEQWSINSLILNLKQLWSLMILRSGLNMAGLCYYPTTLSFITLEMQYSISSSSDILKAVEDREENLFIDYFEQYSLPEILAENPKLVGISINDFSQIIPGLTLAKLIKDKGVYVVIGGVIFTKELKIKEDFFCLCDSFVQSDGEVALLELVKQLEDNIGNLSGVPNLVWRDKLNKKIIFNSVSHIRNLDILPAPNFDGIKLGSYFNIFSEGPRLPLSISTGCYWNKCGFCDLSYRKEYKHKSVPLILKDIRTIINKYQIKSFFFTGEALHPKLLKDFASAIIENKLNITWEGYARFEDEFTDDLCKILAASGCKRLWMGLESGSQRILDLTGKGTKLSTVEAVLKNLFMAKISVGIFALVGFPTETKNDAQRTIEFILKQKNNLDTVGFYLRFNNIAYNIHSSFFTCPIDYKIINVSILDESDDLESRNKYAMITADGLTYNEAKDAVTEWDNLVCKHFFYYGIRNIVATCKKSQNTVFNFIFVLFKLSWHCAAYNTNKYIELITSNLFIKFVNYFKKYLWK